MKLLDFFPPQSYAAKENFENCTKGKLVKYNYIAIIDKHQLPVAVSTSLVQNIQFNTDEIRYFV